MDEIESILSKIGLNGSEIKVYLTLLKRGSCQKKDIVREARISPSKIYHVLDKLANKGLVSIITKNKVKNFTAANPLRIKDLLAQKKKEIIEEEKMLQQIIPKIFSLQDSYKDNSKIEVYTGWKGIETVYKTFLDKAKKGDKAYILGAGTGPKENKFELFFTKHGREAFLKGIIIKVIFNESSREYVNRIEVNINKKYEKRFLFDNTPSEIIIHKDYTGILIRKSEPIIIGIQDRETAQSFINYFNELWAIAKE